MKQYIKYIVLFIILIFVGIVGINLYNNKNLQGTTKNTPNTTINQNKDSKNSNTKSEEKEQTKETTETKEEIKKTEDTNTSSTNDNSSTTTNTNESSSTNQSSTTGNNSSTVTYSSPNNSNTTNQSTNSNASTTQSSNNGYNILDVDPTTSTNQSISSYSNSSTTTNNSTANQSIDVSTTTQNNNNSSESDNILDVEIENSSTKNNSNASTSTTNSSSISSSSNKANSNSSSSTKTNNNQSTTNNTQNNNTNNNQTTNKTTNSTTTTQTTIKDGNIIGATGYGAVPSMNILRAKPTSNSTVITRIELNSPFRIIGVSNDGNWWRVKYKGKYGYVDNNYCLINLPDYIPSINYYMVEALKNNSVSSGVKLSIYGKKLYTAGKVYNPRLEKNEFIVPVTYSFAKKILKAQTLALKDGYSLKIYDAYRPTSVAKQMRDSLTALYNSNATVRKNINYSYEGGNTYEWGQSWFIAQSLSAHSLASAIDVSLTKKGETKSLKMPSRMNELSTKSIKYKYGVSGQTTVRNDLYSSNMTPAAKRLDAYMMKSGLTSLASEWWHFQDNVSYNRMKTYIPNGLNFQPTKIVSTK